MNWPRAYLRQIQAGKTAVSRKVRAVYEREISWMDNPPSDPAFKWHYDEAIAQRHIDFMQTFCRQSKGKKGKQPILLIFAEENVEKVQKWHV